MPSVLLNDKTFDVGHLAFGHDLIVLSDGRLLATWVPVGDDGTDMGLISGQFYGADGAAQGAEFTLANGYGSNSGLGLSTFALGHGGFAIISHGFSSNENTFEHKIDFFDKFVTITKEINNTFSGFNAPDVAFPSPHGGIYIFRSNYIDSIVGMEYLQSGDARDVYDQHGDTVDWLSRSNLLSGAPSTINCLQVNCAS